MERTLVALASKAGADVEEGFKFGSDSEERMLGLLVLEQLLVSGLATFQKSDESCLCSEVEQLPVNIQTRKITRT